MTDDLATVDRYWRACNYLSVAMMFLQDNVLLREPLKFEHVKPRVLGHWGSSPGLSFVWAHLNRVILRDKSPMLFIAGPGHGAPGVIAPTYLEGRLCEIYPEFTPNEQGIRELCRHFSSPGGFGSHCTPEIPGSIHEGGELGYALSHAFGAAFDNPEQIVACVIGDGEAETGALATSWHSNKFLNPERDGTVLPILHLNGFKIANPTILARIPEAELISLMRGYGWDPIIVHADMQADTQLGDLMAPHKAFAAALDEALLRIQRIRSQGTRTEVEQPIRPDWPMIVLRTPKGWTGPDFVDGHRMEGSWRSHQVPLPNANCDCDQLAQLERWLRSYQPATLFDSTGRLHDDLILSAPIGAHRMSANPLTNATPVALQQPDIVGAALTVDRPGCTHHSNTAPLGAYLAGVIEQNPDNFRLFGPDETASNRLDAVYKVTGKAWQAITTPDDVDGGHLDPMGRVMEMLSEHTLEGWLESYLLTGRHGLLHTYESFAPIITSMVGQHAKWLEVVNDRCPWRARSASLNLLLTSTVWRQDHNGFSHQDPGFISLLTNRSSRVSRLYFPPDANSLLAVTDHCLRTRGTINVIVADKHPHLQYLDAAAATEHVRRGIGRWAWASQNDQQNDQDPAEPDLVMAGCGDVVTQEALAATALVRQSFPELRIRFVNIVDPFRLRVADEHPHGLDADAYAALFGESCPVVMNFHGYPGFVRQLLWGRPEPERYSLHGYGERGSIDTPLKLAIVNRTDRFRLAVDAMAMLVERGALDAAQRVHAAEVMCTLEARILQADATATNSGVDADVDAKWTWPDQFLPSA